MKEEIEIRKLTSFDIDDVIAKASPLMDEGFTVKEPMHVHCPFFIGMPRYRIIMHKVKTIRGTQS